MLRETGTELSILNPNPAFLNGPKYLHQLVRTSSDTNEPAIDFLENGSRRELSYERLHTLSDKWACEITRLSARLKTASAIVPVFLPQSPELYIALLAILKAGKAFCPLGLDAPIDRLNFILDDVSADILLTNAAHASKFSQKENLQLLLLDDEPSGEDDIRQVSVSQDVIHLAYVLYTSGSTGLPKAVSVSHRAATQSLLAHDRHIPAFRRFLQFAAPTFDVSIFEIFFPLFRGCTLVGCSRSQLLEDLPGTLRSLEVDAAELTPTVVTNLLQGRKSVPTLNLLLTIGEMLTRNVVDEFGGNHTQKSILWGMYGPTEAAIHCTLQAGFESQSPVGNIGVPFDTVSAFIVAPISETKHPTDLAILPVGSVGELVVGGPQVADEYLNRPELTAAAFLQHPKYGQLYRTGDKARILPDGTMECLGRIVSGQVKLRGQRVELGEIERIVAKAEGCHTSAALIIADDLIAFCAVGTKSVTSRHVLHVCKQWLPSYMIPSDVFILPSMPQLPSGKIDKKALEAQYLQHRQTNDFSNPYDTQIQSPIRRIVEEVLCRRVSPDATLAYAGLDSLRSIRVASLMRREGYDISAVDLLSVSTLQDLIDTCQSRSLQGLTHNVETDFHSFKISMSLLPELEKYRKSIVDIIPCTPLQEAMLTETIIRPNAYCNWIEIELDRSYSLSSIISSIQSVAKANEILRSGFSIGSTSSNTFVQVIWEALEDSQVVEVTKFSRRFSLGSAASLLRPFTVQIQASLERPKLLFQLHHALYDGWSFDLISHDLAKTLQGKQLDLRPQYREVVSYNCHKLGANGGETSESYWAYLLKDFQPTLLPNYHGRLMTDERLHSISEKSSVDPQALFDFSQRLAINPQVLYQAAVAFILSSYIGSSDIAFGTVSSGRTLPITGIEEIVGPCIASLPLRFDSSKCHDVKTMLHQINTANREMLRHSTLPLRDIAKSCGIRPGNRLFDVLFVWQQSLFSTHNSNSVIKVIDSADELEFSLVLEFEPRDGYISSRATYESSILPQAQVWYLLHQIDDLVHHFLQHPEGGMQLIQAFDQKSLSIANPAPVQERITHGPAHAVERWASESPNAKALIFGSLSQGSIVEQDVLSYAELNNRANQLARMLQDVGVAGDGLVCVIMEKSIDLYVSILAILKTGNGYLPLVPETPPERIRQILTDANVEVCITESSISKHIRSDGNLRKVVEIDTTDLSGYSDNNLDVPYVGSHLAYAVFTSGSTGTPKGVLVTQDNLVSNLEVLFKIYPTSTDSRLLQSCSQAFDVSVFEIFFSWYSGMCLCSARKDDLYHDLEDAINRLHITHLSLTPTVASLINPDNVPEVKFLVTAGEAVNEHVKRQWAGRGLYQGYGPSETTNICTVRASVNNEDLINNIGAPFSNTSTFVLDPGSQNLLPRGAVGELCFGGSQVFRGYLNKPELNAQKILNHPVYGRIYRSGDMGRLLPDDSILFTGRADDQVKIRGQRVELGEITSIILDSPEVEDCASLLFQFEASMQRLVSFWVPKGEAASRFEVLAPEKHRSTVSAVFDSLTLKLPAYMIPTHLVPISRIPLTTQTKIDKRLLLSAYKGLSNDHLDSVTSTSSSEDGSELYSEQEKKIAEALADTLHLPLTEISRNSSFFSIGLDSVSAIHLCSRLRSSGFDDVPVSMVLKEPTVARLCAACGTKTAPLADSQRLSTDKADLLPSYITSNLFADFRKSNVSLQKVLPCTPLQEAMLSAVTNNERTAYCNTMTFSVTGSISRMQEIWSQMFERHDILRTGFYPTDNPRYPFVQLVLEKSRLEWDELQPDQDVDIYAREVLAGRLQSSEPPVKMAIRKSGTSPEIIFCCHHALYDGIAVSNLLSEIETLHHGLELESPIPYERYLQQLADQDLKEADEFWKSALADLEPTMFPNLSGTATNASGTSSLITKQLQTSLNQVMELSRDCSVSLLPIFHGAWAKILHFYLGEEDVCFGNVVSGRTLPSGDLDRLVAPCFNTLPVRLNFDYGNSNSALVQQLHKINVEISPFQLTPLRRIQARIANGQGPLFDTLVILQQHSLDLDESIWTLKQDSGTMDLPIVIEIAQDKANDRLTATLHFRTSLLSDAGAERVLETFDHALQSLIRFPRSAARDTVGFPADLLAESNMSYTAFEFSEQPLLHSAFERNAALFPQRIALDFHHGLKERTTWSYEELNQQANRIAHALISLSITPEDIVPILVSKSPEFYASILGVLKAGGAFTPIYQDLPIARKQFMLSELRPKVVLCAEKAPVDWCGDVLLLDISEIKERPSENPNVRGLQPNNLAYCLYTSGSTGLPKAVSMEHKAPMQTIQSSRSLIPWTPDSRLLQYAAISFDMCYYDCFLAWTFGFTLCAAPQNDMLNDLASIVNSLNVDLLDLTPSVAASITRAQVPFVKWLYCIGEPMSSDVVQEWGGACVNSYGPTEAAFCTTIFPVQKDIKTTVFGKPFPSTAFAVFPRKGERTLPVFGEGELYIGGAQLARGYYGKTELTEERFVQRHGQKFYKSGDMVRMLADGNFEFIGRADDQVKIRGQRVELGEINHVVQDADNRISAVSTQIMKVDKSSKDQLVAFIVTANEVGAEQQGDLKQMIQRAAKESLPPYMIPQFLILIEKIPKSIAGKIDKQALRRLFLESDDINQDPGKTTDSTEQHEWTKTELLVKEILANLSDVSPTDIGPNTSIYQLGLDSISAVQAAAALRKRGRKVNATDVLKYICCIDLAAYIDELPLQTAPEPESFDFVSFETKLRGQLVKTLDLGDDSIERVRPCTPLQEGMLSQFIAKEGAVYLNFLQLQLDEGTDLHKLQAAWQVAMENHIMLRTGFAQIKYSRQSFAMINYNPGKLALPWEDQEQDVSVQEWVEGLQQRVLGHLHQLPWCIRVIRSDGQVRLDLAMFHAIFDAQSLQLIFRDVVAAYKDQQLQQAISVEPVIGHILQQSRVDESQSVRFWKDLGSRITPTRFPNLAPVKYEEQPPQVISKSSSRSLKELEAGCRKANITLQAAGIASWASLLSTYTGEPSVTCGVILSGRNTEAAETAVFPCISTVPFAVNVQDDRNRMLQDIVALNANIQVFQFTPLNEIQRLVGYPNEPLFDSLFAFQKLASEGEAGDLWTTVDENATTEYAISIELEPKQDQLELRLTFLPHIIPEEQATLILDQLDHLLNQFIGPKIDTHSTPTNDNALYSSTPAKEPVLPSEITLLHEFVEVSAIKHPERIAFEFATSIADGKYTSQSWSYADLDAEGNKIAHLLISHGVTPGGLVGVCFDKCPEASFAILGILKAGCAFVALDPGAPSARRAFIVEDAGLSIVLSMRAQSSDLPENLPAQILNLDVIKLDSTPRAKPTLERSIQPEDRSYCLYTSGTTGTPKGCELTHENAVQALLAFQRLFADHWDDDSRWLQFASFHFDVSVLEQYWSWSVGIRVVSAPRDLIFEDLAGTIKTLDITHIDLTPSLARILHPDDVPSLCKGVFITGGESLKQEILDVWGPKGVIYNGYGPTEATIGVTMYPRVPENGKPSNIGPAFDNVGSFVLKPGTDIPVLRGGVGELCVSGKLVGKGYLNRPELTEERFPYIPQLKERVYRTGDLVRILHDSTFDFLGRADDQVKLRGQRLEIGEINSVIKQASSAVSDVATIVLKHPKQQKEQLVSFVVTATAKDNSHPEVLLGNTPDLESSREACQDRLPGYMVPTHFIALSTMPLSANNKAENRRLREMYYALSLNDLQLLSSSSSGKEEQWSQPELRIREVLKDTLRIGAEDIAKASNIFELGLDSISVIGFSSALKQAGFAQAAASTVMKNTTITRLAKALSDKNAASIDQGSITSAQQNITAAQHRHRRSVAEALCMDARDISALAPCTPLQQGMIARSLEGENGLYFNSFHFKVEELADIEKIRSAWEDVYSNTQILQTALCHTDEGYVQAVIQHKSLHWTTHTLPDNKDLDTHIANVKKEWWRSNKQLIDRPFEIVLVETPSAKTLIVHIFHALYDGISVELLFKAVWDAYNSRADNVSGPSFQSVLPYGPLRSQTGAQEFWRSQLSGAKYSPFQVLTATPSTVPMTVVRDLHDLAAYETVRRELGVTHQAITQACWATVLLKHTKAPVSLGMIVSGRSINFPGAESVIGPMFNTIPYHHQLEDTQSWASIIKQSHDFNVAAHPYQHIALRDIMKWCKRTPSQPLFDTLFVYQIASGDAEWASNDVWRIQDGEAEADYPLAVEIEQKASDHLRITLVTQGGISNDETSKQLLDDFEDALRQLLHSPDTVVELGFTVEPKERESRAPRAGISTATGNFSWNENALAIRYEVAQLAGVETKEVSESTSIFELGLDSIDAIKLSSKLKKRGVDLPVSGIMRGLTITNMLGKISNSKSKWQQQSSDMVFNSHKRKLEAYAQRRLPRTGNIQHILPLTPLQEGLVADMIASEYRRYFNHDVLKLSPDTNVDLLQNALKVIVERSPILRTSFVEIDDPSIDYSFAQIVHQQPHDFSKILELDAEPDFPQLFESIREAAIISTDRPPFYIHFVKTSSQNYIVLSIAHALYDGWSLGLLHTDIQRAYEGQFKPRPNHEFALRQMLTASGSDAVAFWRDFLSDVKPTNFQRRATDKQGVIRKEKRSDMKASDLSTFAKRNNVTLQTLGQTAYAFVLGTHGRSLDVTFGSVLSGRDSDRLSELLFPTMNTVAIRTILHGSRLEMLQYVQENFAQIKQYQHFPLRKVQALAQVQGQLFESLFIYQKKMSENEGKEVKLYESIEGHSDVEYPVCVEMEFVNGELVWRCAVQEEVFDQEGAEGLLRDLDRVLKSIVEEPHASAIDFTVTGSSICGLPAFQDDTTGSDKEVSTHPTMYNDSATAKTIREVLALVSKTPEEEITEGMTIFHIGLDSISAIKVSSLLRKQSIILSVGEMLRAGTVEQMAKIVDERKPVTEEDNDATDAAISQGLTDTDTKPLLEQAGIDESNVEQMLPATAGQVYVLSSWLNSGGVNFFPEFSYKLTGSITFEELRGFWRSQIAENSILRTCLLTSGMDRTPFVQVVLRQSQESISDISGLDEQQTRQIIKERTEVQPYVHLFTSVSSVGWDLRLVINHALYDGVSLPLLVQQLQDRCNGQHTSQAPSNIFKKFIATGSSDENYDSRKGFWTKYLRGVHQKHQPQPTSTPTSKTEIYKPKLLDNIHQIDIIARKHGLTTQSLFLAFYAKLYATLSQTPSSNDVVIGIYLANRSHPSTSISTTAIPTVNIVPLRVSTPLESDVLDSAAQIQYDIQDISSPVNSAVGLWEIMNWTGVTIDTFVNFLKLPEQSTESSASDGKVVITQENHWDGEITRVAQTPVEGFVAPKEVVDGSVQGAYLHAIDIEATIRKGALDVGVFAPEGMLSLQDGEKLMEDMKREIDSLVHDHDGRSV